MNKNATKWTWKLKKNETENLTIFFLIKYNLKIKNMQAIEKQ